MHAVLRQNTSTHSIRIFQFWTNQKVIYLTRIFFAQLAQSNLFNGQNKLQFEILENHLLRLPQTCFVPTLFVSSVLTLGAAVAVATVITIDCVCLVRFLKEKLLPHKYETEFFCYIENVSRCFYSTYPPPKIAPNVYKMLQCNNPYPLYNCTVCCEKMFLLPRFVFGSKQKCVFVLSFDSFSKSLYLDLVECCLKPFTNIWPCVYFAHD